MLPCASADRPHNVALPAPPPASDVQPFSLSLLVWWNVVTDAVTYLGAFIFWGKEGYADNSTGSAGAGGWMGWHLHHGCAAGPLRPTRTSGSLPTTGHTLKRVPSSCGKKRRARFGLSKGEITCRSVRVLHARCAQEQTCRVSGRRTVPAGECGARAEGVLLDLCVFWPPEVTVGAGCGVGLAVSLPIFCPTVHGLHTRGLAA